MNPNFIRQSIIDNMRLRGHSFDSARMQLLADLGVPSSPVIDEVVEQMRDEAREHFQLVDPRGVVRRDAEDDLRDKEWYTGPREEDIFWPTLKRRLQAGSLADVVDEIDRASTKVVAHFSDPGVHRLKKKGLVVGYVQSGKTANYTAVMAKAADAGYRLFIVLSGIHNNLRRQTQVRINQDLGVKNWFMLTDDESDFGKVKNGSALMNGRTHMIAVVKKNPTRLKNLRDWLRDVDEAALARTPVLILDDEADQATPNSKAARDELSKINALLREIWAAVPTGCYVGYTATPFANVFMNPDDEEELYPSDFIFDLPRPDAYFGAERIFGRNALDDDDEPDQGLDMVRTVTPEEADLLRPPGRADQRAAYDPELPDSLIDALRWFVLAVSIRRLRGQGRQHSSMLVHTSQYVAPHFAMKNRVDDLFSEWRSNLDTAAFEKVFLSERDRVQGLSDFEMPEWEDVEILVPEVLKAVRVVVDNGYSSDRLDYGRVDDNGNPVVETVVAIGGGTLSRGLTLEGLMVSYFTRTSNTYDTLLQMGRWFGYRPGYEDLPRIWMPDDLASDFAFLALVEEEIRQEMRRLEDMRVTPRQFGVRVRAHPGRLSITSTVKMHHADRVQVSYAGQRHQTIVFHEKQLPVLRSNIEVTRSFLRGIVSTLKVKKPNAGRTQIHGVQAETVADFLSRFQFHERQAGLRSDYVAGWIREVAPNSKWNVVVIGNTKKHRSPEGVPVELGELDLGIGRPVPLVNRAPLAKEREAANIKALLSPSDWVADFDDVQLGQRLEGERYDAFRRRIDPRSGVLLIVPISGQSVPLRAGNSSRRAMEAELPLIGLGVIFPDGPDVVSEDDGTYYSVTPDWTPAIDEEVELPADTEASKSVDGNFFKEQMPW